MKLLWHFAGLMTLGLSLSLVGCGSKETATDPVADQKVVVYTSVDDVFVRPIAEKFERQTGIKVRLVPDTEETKSTGLLNRLIAEKDRPQADVFWSGDPVRAAILKAKGVSQPYHSPQAVDLPTRFSDPAGHWTGFSARARILLVNNDLIPRDQVPRSVLDLVDPKYRGKACIANPLFGTTSMHAAALFATLGDDKARQFFEAFLANGGKVLSSNGEVRRRVASGEFAVGVADTDDYRSALNEGKPVSVVYPDQDGIGTLVVPNCAVLIANAPHLRAGQRFIDYLLSAQTEQALAESDAAQMPVRRAVPVPDNVMPLEKLKSMQVDYGELGNTLEVVSKSFLKDWADRGSR